jgi:hypothetical protein
VVGSSEDRYDITWGGGGIPLQSVISLVSTERLGFMEPVILSFVKCKQFQFL